MPLHPAWQDIAFRLLLTLAAGAIIGFNREQRGRAAGLRTTMLVCLAASVAMIQANLLEPSAGKGSDFFGVMDYMRLPLGILSGIGFIGGGAILRRGDLVTGVTTAATIWMATVIGLCLGGGQLALGTAATLLGAAILWAVKLLDMRLASDRHLTLEITTKGASLTSVQTLAAALPHGVSASPTGWRHDSALGRTVSQFEVNWRAPKAADPPTDLLQHIESLPDVLAVSWRL